jgi:hypothetical protein
MSDLSSKCKHELLVQISSILKNSNQIPSKSIEFQILELPLFLIQILYRILKRSNKESYSLFNYLQIYILFDFFWDQEGHLLIESIRFSLNLFELKWNGTVHLRPGLGRLAHGGPAAAPLSHTCASPTAPPNHQPPPTGARPTGWPPPLPEHVPPPPPLLAPTRQVSPNPLRECQSPCL